MTIGNNTTYSFTFNTTKFLGGGEKQMAESKFKVGDTVRVIKDLSDCSTSVGKVFEIEKIDEDGDYIPNNYFCSCRYFKERELERVDLPRYIVNYSNRLGIPSTGLVGDLYGVRFNFGADENPATRTMARLSRLARKLLSADTRKMVEAGFLSADLEVTRTGEIALASFLFEKFGKEMAQEARRVVREQKKNRNAAEDEE